MQNEPQLDLGLLDTHSLNSIAIADLSKYPVGFVKTTPTLQVTPPGFERISITFTPSSIQVYKSSNLGIVCEWCEEKELPDGIWKFKYSLYPSTKYYVEKTIPRVDRLLAKFDEAFLTLDITECDEAVKKADKLFLQNIETYIEGAMAAGNKCVDKLFHTYYKKASEMLNKFINQKSCATH